tara:strand:+ start:190 stop:666 length:477 start_codon:yes stop_codon:yes gene_type:complete
MPVKSFKGIIAQDEVQKINLSNNDGKTGYRIIKFQVFPHDIDGSTSHEDLVQVWTSKLAADNATNDADFTMGDMIAAAYYVRSSNPSAPYVATIADDHVVVDNAVFNQDIYISMKTGQTNQKINYYLELEQIKLDLVEQTVATLQSIRSSSQGTGQKG